MSQKALTAENNHAMLQCADPDNPEVRNIINVVTAPERVPPEMEGNRHRYANSSCGLCGRAIIEQTIRTFPPLESRLKISREAGMILVGFLRGDSKNVYTGTDRFLS